jgi:recombination protein RecT
MNEVANYKDYRDFLNSSAVQAKFKELLGEKAKPFLTSVLQCVSSSSSLQKVDVNSIYTAAMTAAALDLPVNSNLGYAYIVPYKGKAQFQIGYKGFIQLALRTGLFVRINATNVMEGELLEHNRLTGEIKFNWITNEEERKKKKVIGYVSYFKLTNGYESILFKTVKEVEAHAKKYSESYKKNDGQWVENFDGMALKTVTKLNLFKNAPLSIDLQNAIRFDQAAGSDIENLSYVDNPDTAKDEKLAIAADKLNELFNDKNDESHETAQSNK